MNVLTIIGNLTKDPELREVNAQNGPTTVCHFTVAVNHYVKAERMTDYFRVTCWGKMGENAAKYLTKWSKVAVTGPVSARAYTAQDGGARSVMEVHAERVEYLYLRGNGEEARNDGFVPEEDGELPFET